jgi:hypothetical protein
VVFLGAINTAVDFELILKCLIFGLFYFHLTTCFDLARSSSGGFVNTYIVIDGAGCSIVGRGTMLQAGRSRI